MSRYVTLWATRYSARAFRLTFTPAACKSRRSILTSTSSYMRIFSCRAGVLRIYSSIVTGRFTGLPASPTSLARSHTPGLTGAGIPTAAALSGAAMAASTSSEKSGLFTYSSRELESLLPSLVPPAPRPAPESLRTPFPADTLLLRNLLCGVSRASEDVGGTYDAPPGETRSIVICGARGATGRSCVSPPDSEARSVPVVLPSKGVALFPREVAIIASRKPAGWSAG
mmetsp:Transcript_28047/g.78456  ORF Transcript_28047/g.78456 Transcript_28047/m.78456 type:complete len:227 (+) Transcript_28047:160-840(+)